MGEPLTRDEIPKIFRVFKTVHKMMRKRGYLVQERDLNLTLEDFKISKCRDGMSEGAVSLIKSDLDTIFSKEPRDGEEQENIAVFFCPESKKKVGAEVFRKYSDRLIEAKIKCGIVIIGEIGVSALGKKSLTILRSDGIFMEMFTEKELMIDITEHELVPEHSLLSKADKESLLVRYKLKETQLPRIKGTDPVARYLGVRRGDVLRIVRPSETAGKYVTYRLVE